MTKGRADLLDVAREGARDEMQVALPLFAQAEPLVDAQESKVEDPLKEEEVEAAPEPHVEPEQGSEPVYDPEPLEPARALVPADFALPNDGPINTAMRWAYRMGVPASFIVAPLRKPAKPRLVAMVETPLAGDRAVGMALRAGHFQVAGLKAPIGKLDFASPSKLTPPFARAVHGFTWMRDLSSCAPRGQCADTSIRIFKAWLDKNPEPGKGPAWDVELAGLRLLNWLVHAPVLLSGEGEKLKERLFEAIETTARWLDRQVASGEDRLAQVTGWVSIVAAGLLMTDGKPRRLHGEAGLLRTLGELVSDDGGVLSRSPTAQAQAIALLIDLRACYQAVKCDPPPALAAMLGLLVPALLSLRMGDRGLGSWQGSAVLAEPALDALVTASGVRARPMLDARHWGYQRVRSREAVLVMDASPPPKARHARHGCASTLAFEFSHGPQRIIVNCGGAELAGALVPARIEQGLRGTSAHSTLVLDEANSTAVLLNGQIGKGVEEVDFTRRMVEQGARKATRFEASHNGYAARHGLIHRRILILSESGAELRGEDVLEPSTRKGKRGKIGFAIRFHLGRGIDARLTEDGRGVHLALPDSSYWQFRLAGTSGEAHCTLEDSLWADGQGRPHGVQQIVVEGMAARSGERFPWLLKRMG
ncbi:heparinase II/III family protein [Qipengyuania vesicularis]|uniref:heparinase II/III family protein n=1 Tax=Qipengyuania vesicularis TaxID=2867232 RepID=UPI001C88D852|nr:heparinase II/III family protein [Qipengyuania vesicularis]MBX7528151.1 heparinase II/III-family protein [Qipengyuania vesicularis]